MPYTHATYVAIHNGSVRATRELLTAEAVLAHGAAVLADRSGSDTERLRHAIEAMTLLCLIPESRIEYERDLDGCTVPELKALAARHGVELFGARRRDAIIGRLETVRNLRNRNS